MKNIWKEFGNWCESTTNILFALRFYGYSFLAVGIAAMTGGMIAKELLSYIISIGCILIGSFLLAGTN